MLFVDKLLTFFITPLGLTFSGIAAGLILGTVGWRRLRALLIWGSLAALFALSTPIVAKSLLGNLESEFPRVKVEQFKPRDVAVLLGGVFKQRRQGFSEPDAGDAVDRVLYAASLYRAGKVRKVIVSGGNLPWRKDAPPESNSVGQLLSDLGVPPEDQLHDPGSSNTYENAVATKIIWEQQHFSSGYLVTSASHMRRAYAVFKKQGLAVAPAATDHQVTYPLWETVLDLLPTSGALHMTSVVFRERVGYWVYAARGWL